LVLKSVEIGGQIRPIGRRKGPTAIRRAVTSETERKQCGCQVPLDHDHTRMGSECHESCLLFYTVT